MDTQEIFRTIIRASNFVAILPALVALGTYRRHSTTQHYLAILVWGAALVGLCGGFFTHVLNRPNLWLMPLFVILNFTMFTLIFRHYINRRFIPYLIGGYALFSLGYGIATNFFAFGEPLRIVEAGAILVYCVQYFRTTLRRLDEENLTQTPMFWISCGAFIYYSASFMFFLTTSFIVNLTEVEILVWAIHASLAIILYAFFFVMAFLKRRQTT